MIRSGSIFYMRRNIVIATILCLILSSFGQVAGAENQRIVSLAPSTTEILFALGLEQNIVGVTTFCNYPPAVSEKEKVGTFSQPDIERIVSLKPDIIFATGLEQAYTVERLRQLNLNFYVSDPSNIEELYESILEIAELTDRRKEAKRLIAVMRSKIERIETQTELISQEEKVKVFIEIWHDPLLTAGRGSFVDELVTLAGGINIADDTPRPYSYFSAEQLIVRDPGCIILGHRAGGNVLEFVKGRLGWSQINAVKKGYVYDDVDPDLFMRPGPRLAEGLVEIHERLYP